MRSHMTITQAATRSLPARWKTVRPSEPSTSRGHWRLSATSAWDSRRTTPCALPGLPDNWPWLGGLDAAECDAVCEASLLRWSGCTANASDFAELGPASTLPVGKPWSPCGRDGQSAVDAAGSIDDAIEPLARIHCEVSVEVARMLGLDNATQTTLWNILRDLRRPWKTPPRARRPCSAPCVHHFAGW